MSRWSSSAVRRLMAPPLPEASQPSKSTSTGGPRRPSPISPPSCSRSASSRSCAALSRSSYSLRLSLGERSTSSRRPTTRSLSETHHHVLQLGVLLDRVDRHVAAVARLLEAVVRHLVHERDVVVDPHRAELQ